MECLKCGSTGVKLNGKPCDCGAYVEIEKKTPIEEFVPEIYRGVSNIIGVKEIVAGEFDRKKTFQNFLNDLTNGLTSITGHPSLFIDLSETPLGAYEVYFALAEKIINKEGDFKESIRSIIKVNELDTGLLKDCDVKLREGRPIKECYAYIISDFPISKFPSLSEYMKIVNPVDARFPSKYPLNMYHLKIKSTNGGM